MPNLNTSILEALPVVVPPPPEQRAIADILASLDDKIGANLALEKTAENLAAAVFESAFLDFIGMETPVESEIGPIPVGLDRLPAVGSS
jgi:restriction endonuclease S subunit